MSRLVGVPGLFLTVLDLTSLSRDGLRIYPGRPVARQVLPRTPCNVIIVASMRYIYEDSEQSNTVRFPVDMRSR